MKTYRKIIEKIVKGKFNPVINREVEKTREIAHEIYLQNLPDDIKNSRNINKGREYMLIFVGENMYRSRELKIRFPKRHKYTFKDFNFYYTVNPDAEQAKRLIDQYFIEDRLRHSSKIALSVLKNHFSWFETEEELIYAFPELIEYFDTEGLEPSNDINLTEIQKNRVNMVNDFFESHLR